MGESIAVIGVPMDLGQNRRGVDMGPSAIRYAGVIERLQALGHRIQSEEDLAVSSSETTANENPNLKHLASVSACNQLLSKKVETVVAAGDFPLVLGGDHSIAIGSLSGISKYYDNLGVIWFDAHGDLNTAETSPSGNIHGMSLAVSLGFGDAVLTSIGGRKAAVKEENVVIIGARAFDEAEKEFVRNSKMKVYTMHEVDRLGMPEVMRQVLAHLSACDGVHLSLDLDGMDPIDAPGVGTPVVGGLSYRESHLAMEMLQEAGCITSCEFVEVNPILDEKNKTAEAAVALIGSLFGEKLK